MFRYYSIIDIEDLVNDNFRIGISLKSGITFKFQDCYCRFRRTVHKDSRDVWERIIVSYYTDSKCYEKAKQKIRQCLDLLSFIFIIPFDYEGIQCEKVDVIEEVLSNNRTKKIIQLQEISDKVDRFRKSRGRFFDVLAIFRKGIQYGFMDGFIEEAYLYYFKSIENVAKEYFDKEAKDKLDINKEELENILLKIFKENFGIVYSDNKINDIAGVIKRKLINISSGDIYSKIALFCNRNKIRVDYDLLGRAVSLRNKIAHEDNVNIDDYMEEYFFILKLSREIIAKKYFNKNYNKIYIKSRFKI